MRVYRMLPCLMLIAGALAVTAPGASATSPSVDPSTLQPPPPSDARCVPTGRYVICHTVVDFSVEAAVFAVSKASASVQISQRSSRLATTPPVFRSTISNRNT